PSTDPIAIAIAPVQASGDGTRAYDEIASAIADEVVSLRGVRVVPPLVFREASKRDPSLDLLAAARSLGANWLVETTLRTQGGRGGVRARLVDVARRTQIWAPEPIEVAEGETFALEDRLVREVTAALKERISLGAASGPASPEARDYYERARAAYERQ